MLALKLVTMALLATGLAGLWGAMAMAYDRFRR
jgi:hypothetical protein